jgi:transposase
MKTASPEIRAVAVKAYGAGISRQQIADIVGYHLNSVSRWIREFTRENRLKAHPRGHRASIFSEAERREIIALIGKQPDITLEELRSHFAKACSLNAIHKLLKTLGFVVKKNSSGKRARTRGYTPGQSRMGRVSKQS